ncbi:MAG: restriction endonuclease subunit S [Zoogloea oleivorans]|jgi:type I restriction enzyme S subunit|uniref:restriction endonuclease subunit S n=1 Tax=Zoogloea oleivorans TaxID=1552750 RepID=UPI002A36258E|nr:restriction endonuclease subunit S [Zoogloea oleivorans]MDY0037769.1 restriction endonuclease subunit S [Zoogloea oleivorans]
MEAQRFLAEFGHIANAPGGVERLRELIYQFAVTGRLVPQQADEGGAQETLGNVTRIRQRLIAAKQWKRIPKLESAPLAPPAIELPPSWRWSRLLDLGEINPRNEASGEVQATFVPMAAVSEKHSAAVGGEVADWSTISKGYTHFANGDVLLAKITPCFENGKAAVVSGLKNGIGAGSTEFHVFRPMCEEVRSGYVYLFLRSPLFRVKGQASMTGTAGQKRLPTDYFALCAMPFPPKAEQSRIVAKVDELMALCDKLEAQQQARRQLQNALRQSALQAVAAATSPHELQTTWARLEANFGQLFSAPEDVVAFKGLILDLAVSGELLNIEHRHAATGADLLDAIAAKRIEWSRESVGQEQKEALAMLKKLRTQQVSIPDATLPEHWAWASLLQVSQAVVDCHNKTAPYVSEGIHLIRTTDIRNGRMDLSATRKISEETYAYWARRMPPKGGDIFFTREAPMGEAAIVPDGERVCLGQRSMLIRLFPDLYSNRFLLCVIQSPSFQARMIEAAIGMTVKHLRVGGVEDLVVPVPPKAEQDRIVAIVDVLFRMCDHYADQLSRKQRIATNLAASAVSGLTGIAIEQEEEPMKAPQTELIAPLRLGTTPDIKAQAPLATILARHHGEMSAKDLWQRFGGEIDAFYAQLKTEVAHGWILEPAPAEMREKPADAVSA